MPVHLNCTFKYLIVYFLQLTVISTGTTCFWINILVGFVNTLNLFTLNLYSFYSFVHPYICICPTIPTNLL